MNNDSHLRGIMDSLPVCVMLLGADGSILEMNPAGLFMVEADSFERISDKPYQHIVAPEFRSTFQTLIRKVADGAADSLEYQITGLRGTRRWLDTHAVPFRSADGSRAAILAVTRDTTERVQREGKTRYDHKMEAIANLTSGIAHDFNNILTAIIGYANVMKVKLRQDDPLRPMALQILASSERASNLTKSLLAFGTNQILTLEPLDLNEAVRQVVRTFSREVARSVTVSARTAPADLTIMADREEIERALLNMLANARDAVASGGGITVTTGTLELEDTFIAIHGYGTKGTYAVVAVTDTGSGMDEQTRKKVFEPFFTTKETGKGVGLGLAIVYGIIKSHRGFVNVYSEPGIGTTFKVYLPLSGARPLDEAAASAVIPEGRGETILIADDDAAVLQITTSVLEQFGYRVLRAMDGVEALQLFQEQGDRIGLVMLDLFMPRKDGKAVYEEIRRLRPHTRVIFTSGHTADFIHHRVLLDQGVPFISKPVSPRDLLSKIREVLES